jgi:DNA polymerase III subunit epsilon
VETPNFKNDRICSLGLTVIDNGAVTASKYFLVNPECAFSYQNIQIHGITPGEVSGAPTFPEVWEEIGALFRAHLVAAHNATFDLCVLRKTLLAYGIHEAPARYVCTLRMARRLLKEAENHRLPTLCEWYGIPLEHHNASSDSDACAKVLCRLVKSGLRLEQYINAYDLAAPGTPGAPYYRKNIVFD